MSNPEDRIIVFDIIDVDHTAVENLVVAGTSRELLYKNDDVQIEYGGGVHHFTVKSIEASGTSVSYITPGTTAFVELVSDRPIFIYHAVDLIRLVHSQPE